MSGGHFDYKQYSIGHIAEEIDTLIEHNDSTETNEYGDLRGRHYEANTIEEMRRATTFLRIAEIFAQRVDWLVSGDDGEDSFHRRLHKDLANLCAIDPLAAGLLSERADSGNSSAKVLEDLANALTGGKKAS